MISKNRRHQQLLILWIGFCTAAFICLYPPYIGHAIEIEDENGIVSYIATGGTFHHWIFDDHQQTMNVFLLWVQLTLVGLFTVVSYHLMK